MLDVNTVISQWNAKVYICWHWCRLRLPLRLQPWESKTCGQAPSKRLQTLCGHLEALNWVDFVPEKDQVQQFRPLFKLHVTYLNMFGKVVIRANISRAGVLVSLLFLSASDTSKHGKQQEASSIWNQLLVFHFHCSISVGQLLRPIAHVKSCKAMQPMHPPATKSYSKSHTDLGTLLTTWFLRHGFGDSLLSNWFSQMPRLRSVYSPFWWPLQPEIFDVAAASAQVVIEIFGYGVLQCLNCRALGFFEATCSVTRLSKR